MSGIAFLRRLLMKQAMKKSAGSSGIMSLNKNLVNDVEIKVKRWVDSAKKQGADIDKMGEQEIKYIVELNKPKGPMIGGHEVIGPGHPRHEGITESLFGKKPADVLDLSGKKIDTSKPILGGKNVELTHNEKIDWLVKNVSPTAEQTIPPRPALEQMLKDGREDLIDHFFEMHTKKLGKPKVNIDTSDLKHPGLVKKMMTDEKLKPTLVQGDVVTETVTNMKAMTPMDAMKEANLVIARKGKYKNLTIEESQDILKKTNDHIFERDIKYDEFGEIIKPDPEDFAQGGRTGYKDGFKVYPQISASKSNVPLDDGYNVDLQNLLYGGTIAYEKGPFSGGIEYLKGKNKYDFKDRDDTLFKDTEDNELLNLILKMELESGLKARLKANKEGGTFNISKSFAGGGRTSTGLNYLLGEDDQNSRVPYSKGSRKKSWTDRIAGWTGGTNVMAGEIGLETWDLLNNLLQSGGLYAEGGRTGFGLGGMTRRAFLKLMGGTAAGIGVAKSGLLGLIKGSKPGVVKSLTSVPIKSGADGMPAWFKPLVNKVIAQGDDVTKTHAYKDMQVVHKTTLPESKTEVILTQNIDTGDVVVDIGSGKHGFGAGHHGQPVRLEYKASELIEPTIKKGKVTKQGTKTKEEFWVEEAEFTGGHPENIKFEESSIEKFGQHGSNFDEVEKFATGKVKKVKPTKKKLQTEFESGKAEADAQRWEADYDDSLPDYEDFASGGRVPLGVGGGIMKLLKLFKTKPSTLKEFIDRRKFLQTLILNTDDLKNKRMLQTILEENKKIKGFEFPETGVGSDIHKEIEMILSKDVTKHATGGRVSLSAGGLAGLLGE